MVDPFGVVHSGKRGNDDPRRVTVIQREVGSIDLQRQRRVGVQDLVGLQDRVIEGAEPLREDTMAEPGCGRPAAAARSASRTPVQVCVVDHPSTQAIGSSTVWRGIASTRPDPAAPDRSPPTVQAPPRTGDSRVDTGCNGGAVDLKFVGAPAVAAAAGKQQRRTAGESAQGLPGGQRRDQQRTAADDGQCAATTQGRQIRVGCHQPIGVARLGHRVGQRGVKNAGIDRDRGLATFSAASDRCG